MILMLRVIQQRQASPAEHFGTASDDVHNLVEMPPNFGVIQLYRPLDPRPPAHHRSALDWILLLPTISETLSNALIRTGSSVKG